ncbi:MAG: PP2C family protein-serine/threonine phosphatase, partial [Methylococcaceae bacterium]|nr:PP2C family protein-serine/threonine phosphatase [Methylococcaceae bacterium]
DSTYTTEILNMKPGVRLFIYSDGIIECENPAGEFFGAERLQDLLKTASSSSLDEITGTVWAHLKDWRGKDFFEDDISLLILER